MTMRKRYIKGNKIIYATDKAYETLYRHQGFRPYIETNMTKAEIIEVLERRGIDYDPKMKKGELLELLV
jgi:hypothetical protein